LPALYEVRDHDSGQHRDRHTPGDSPNSTALVSAEQFCGPEDDRNTHERNYTGARPRRESCWKNWTKQRGNGHTHPSADDKTNAHDGTRPVPDQPRL